MNILPWRDRYSPASLRSEVDSLLGRFPFMEGETRLPEVFGRRAMPPVNIAETEKNWSVAVELPGLNEKDIRVEIMGEQLVISGERKWEEEKKNKEYRSVESQYGSFERSIQLPSNLRLEPEHITATYKRGILEVTVPKLEPTPAAKIPVKAG